MNIYCPPPPQLRTLGLGIQLYFLRTETFVRTGSLLAPSPGGRPWPLVQRALTEMIKLELSLLRIEKETGKTDSSVGRNLND